MSFHSEEQWKEIGSCPDCSAPLYLMGNKVRWHDCPYEHMDEIVERIQEGFRAEKDYVLSKLTPHRLERMLKDILYVA